MHESYSLLLTGLTCASKGLTCVANTGACGNGNLMENLYCESGVCCEPPFDQGGKAKLRSYKLRLYVKAVLRKRIQTL